MLRDATLLRERFPGVNQLNIPDLLRFPLRSWDACSITRTHFPVSIPHIRAIDMPLDGALKDVESFVAKGITEVLIVTGDAPREMGRRVYPTTAVNLIRRLRRDWPHLKIYAAYDPYRQGIRAEYDYAASKLDAGADGFFTQPFFDIRLLGIHAELLTGKRVFWGVAPVTTETSRAYWEATNRTVFPRDFAPTLEWNQAFARRALEFLRTHGGHIYFMPIRIDIERYLRGVLNQDQKANAVTP
ncbi:MAG: methylenetetrahydrofolate reductase [Acidobacteriota bacterium]